MYGNDPYSTPAFAGTTEPPSLPVLTYAPKVGMFAGIDESQAITPYWSFFPWQQASYRLHTGE